MRAELRRHTILTVCAIVFLTLLETWVERHTQHVLVTSVVFALFKIPLYAYLALLWLQWRNRR